jgi:hypothetical protein
MFGHVNVLSADYGPNCLTKSTPGRALYEQEQLRVRGAVIDRHSPEQRPVRREYRHRLLDL